MNQYFSASYNGNPFQLFGLDHLLANLLILLVIVAIAYVLRADQTGQQRERICWLLAGFLIANQLAWDAWQYFNGLWSLAYSLPLQICTLSGVLCAIMVATRSYRLYELLYFWGIAGAGNGLITPDLLMYGFPHFRFWLFFTAHGGIIVAIAFMTLAYGVRPTWRSVWRAVLLTNAYMAIIVVVNTITGGNYMYIARTPEFPTVIDYMGPWPWYIIGLELIGFSCFILAYLPWAIADWRSRLAQVS
jgi:hypothetical integral membrane protein (TIGR02206 family)